MTSSHFATAAVLALAIGPAAYTCARAEISSPVRVWLAGKDGKAWLWLFKLVSCPYCLSHWMAFVAAAIWRPWIISGWPPAEWLVTSLATVAVAALPVLVIKKSTGA